MKFVAALLMSLCSLSALAAPAPEPKQLVALATCQESWLDFQAAPAKGEAMRQLIEADYSADPKGAGMAPKTKATLLGLPITQLFPDSAGMAVGFSVSVEGKFADVKTRLEKQLGYKLEHCESDDEMTTCEHQIAEKKTIAMVADGKGDLPETLVGCVYYYEK